MRLLDYVSKAKTEEYDQRDWIVFDIFEIMTPCSATDHLEVGAAVSLIAATKASLRGQKTVKT